MSYLGSVIRSIGSMFADKMIRRGDFSSAVKIPASDRTDATETTDAAVVAISGNYFRGQLEKHLKDYKSGKGHLSKEVYGRLRQKSINNSSFLNSYDPKASSLYSEYLTAGFSYDTKARFVTRIEEVTRSMSLLQKGSSKSK